MSPLKCLLVRGARRRPTTAALAAIGLLAAFPVSARTGSTPIEELLDRTGKVIQLFWDQLLGVACTEVLSQSKLGKNGKVLSRQESAFDYLVLMHLNGDDLTVEESRQAQRQSGNNKKMPLLVTKGFSTLVLIFHPFFQGSFEYAQLADEVVEGKRLLQVHFQHVPGSRSPAVLQLRGRDYPLALQGTAWVDPDSGAIARMDASLTSPMEDVGLRVLHSDVRYAPMRLTGIEQMYWLPVMASVDAETARQNWQNVHRFTDYKRFSATVKIITNR